MSYVKHTATGLRMKAGDTLQTFRGEFVKLERWEAPAHPGSTGRIHIVDAEGRSASFYPAVCGCEIVEGK